MLFGDRKKYCQRHEIVSLLRWWWFSLYDGTLALWEQLSSCFTNMPWRNAETGRFVPPPPPQPWENGQMNAYTIKSEDSNATPAWKIAGENFQIFAGDLGLWILIYKFQKLYFRSRPGHAFLTKAKTTLLGPEKNLMSGFAKTECFMSYLNST